MVWQCDSGVFSLKSPGQGSGEKWIPKGRKVFLFNEEIGVGRDTGKLSHSLATGWNQQFRDLPYKSTLKTGLWCAEGSRCGEGSPRGAPFSAGVSWSALVGILLSHSGGMDVGTSCDLVIICVTARAQLIRQPQGLAYTGSSSRSFDS